MIASFDYTDMSAFGPHDLCSEIWKETGTETSGWLQLKSAQKDGLCHGDVFFLLWFLWQLLFIPGPNPQCLAWQDPLPFSRLYTRLSLKAVFIDTAAMANQIYLFGLRGKRLDCWFVHHECSYLTEESKNHRKRKRWWGLRNCWD